MVIVRIGGVVSLIDNERLPHTRGRGLDAPRPFVIHYILKEKAMKHPYAYKEYKKKVTFAEGIAAIFVILVMSFTVLSFLAWLVMLLLGAFAATTGYESFAISWEATLAIVLALRISTVGNVQIKGK